MELSLAQQFELQCQLRAIDEEQNIESLRGLCHQLVKAWHVQRAATVHFMRDSLPKCTITSD